MPDALGRAYGGPTFLDQRRRLMVGWGEYLELLRDSEQQQQRSSRAAPT